MGFQKRVREMSSQLFVTLYSIYTIYISLCTQTAETTSPEPFSRIPLYVVEAPDKNGSLLTWSLYLMFKTRYFCFKEGGRLVFDPDCMAAKVSKINIIFNNRLDYKYINNPPPHETRFCNFFFFLFSPSSPRKNCKNSQVYS